MNMTKTTSLDYCQRCGGVLSLVDGTDPEVAKQDQKWSETYECVSCGAKGTYKVDETNNRISETFTGACKSYQ
jgi:hypothetical protein